jgi:hypothetical protein
VEAKEKPHAMETKNKARDAIDAAAKGAKAERISVRKLISILLLKAHDDKTDDACAEAILAEAKNGYGLLFLGLGARSMATTSANSPAPSRSLSIAGFAMLLLRLAWKRF